MIYPYYCDHCEVDFEVTKVMADSARSEKCFTCGKEARRVYSSKVEVLGAKVQDAEWNPAFGKVVKSKRHRDELAKRHNMVEIGNEKVETVHKHFDQERADRRKKRWSDA